MNLAKILAEVAGKYRDKPAIVFENQVFTFSEVDEQVASYSAVLVAMGVRVGDRIAVQLTKRLEFIFLELAALSVGAIALPLNPDYKAEEVEYFLTDSGVTLFFTDSERFSRAAHVLDKIKGLRTVLVDEGRPEKTVSLQEEFERISPAFKRPYPTGSDDVAIICYTSGTTGRSKGAMITHRNLISNTMALKQTWQWTDQDILLHVLPLFHVHGLFVALHGALNAGSTTIMHEKFDPLRTWQTVESQRCTMLMGVPTMYQRLLNQWEVMEPKPNVDGVRVFISGSAPLSDSLFHRFEQATGLRILERYGMTETGMITSNTMELSDRKAKSVGYPLPGVEIRVVSQEGTDVQAGEVGEVLIRGDNVFQGYWGMPDKTRESFSGSWFKSGDLGYQDPEDGMRLYLVGRAKELIITGGYNVYPKEVENVLETHDSVKESAVIGLPDQDFGERVTAVVALKSDAADIRPESLIEFCKQHLASYKCPKRVFLVDQLPRNAMGKLQKSLLVKRYQDF